MNLHMGQFSATDMILGAIAVFWIGKGFFIGFSGVVFSLLGILAGLLVAFKWSRALALSLLGLSSTPRISEGFLTVFSGIVLFIACNLAAALVCRLTRKGLKAARLGGLDRFLGALAGGAKAALLILFLFGSSHLIFSENPPRWMAESRLLKVAARAWPETEKVLAEWKILEMKGFPSIPPEPRP
ncbi:MAG: CvpA family protein [Synergistaceae bacterium]|nr:CvpA family protein [Synergistaceae bacterium]